MNNIAIPVEVQQEIDGSVTQLTVAEQYAIVNEQQYADSWQYYEEADRRIKNLNAERLKITKPLDLAKKGIMDLFSPAVDRYTKIKEIIERKRSGFRLELEKKQREAQAILDEAARKKQEALDKRAEKAEASGKTEKADALREQAAATVAPVVDIAKPKTDGAKMTRYWYARVVDVALLDKAYMVPNEKLLDSVAKSTKGTFSLAGVEFYYEDKESRTGR